MIVLFDWGGREFIVKAKPLGKPGYFSGTVVYERPKHEPPVLDMPVQPEPVSEPAKAAPAVPAPAKVAPEAAPTPEGKKRTLDLARRNKNLGLWDDRAKAFWLWLKDHRRGGGLISKLYRDYAQAVELPLDPTMGFFLSACGERHGYWKISENTNRSRFSLEILD